MNEIYAPHHQLVHCVKNWVPYSLVGDDCCIVKVRFWGTTQTFICQKNDCGKSALPYFTLFNFAGEPKFRISHLGIRHVATEQSPYMLYVLKEFEILQITEGFDINKAFKPAAKICKSVKSAVEEVKLARIKKKVATWNNQYCSDLGVITEFDIKYENHQACSPEDFKKDVLKRRAMLAKYEKEFGKISV